MIRDRARWNFNGWKNPSCVHPSGILGKPHSMTSGYILYQMVSYDLSYSPKKLELAIFHLTTFMCLRVNKGNKSHKIQSSILISNTERAMIILFFWPRICTWWQHFLYTNQSIKRQFLCIIPRVHETGAKLDGGIWLFVGWLVWGGEGVLHSFNIWIPAWMSCHVHLNSVVWFMVSWGGSIDRHHIYKATTLRYPAGSVYLILLSCLLRVLVFQQRMLCSVALWLEMFPSLYLKCEKSMTGTGSLGDFFSSRPSLHAKLFKSFLKVRG